MLQNVSSEKAFQNFRSLYNRFTPEVEISYNNIGRKNSSLSTENNEGGLKAALNILFERISYWLTYGVIWVRMS
jgi:hypothetical protein